MIKPKNEIEKELRRLMILDLLGKAGWDYQLVGHLAGHWEVSSKTLKAGIRKLKTKSGLVYE